MSTSGKATLKQKGLSLIGLLLVLELSFVGLLGFLLYKSEAAISYESHARDLIASLNYIIMLKNRTEDAADYYIGTGKLDAVEEFFETKPILDTEIKSLESELAAFPECSKTGKNFVDTLRKNEDYWAQMVQLRHSRSERNWDFAGAMRHAEIRYKYKDELFESFISFQDSTSKLVNESASSQLISQSTIMTGLGLGLGFNALLAVLLSLIFSKGITSRLAILVDNSRRMALGQSLNPQLNQTDEIGELDERFHKMAGELQEAARKERALTDNANDVICSLEAGKFIKLNPAVFENWGYTPDELRGRAPSELMVGDVENFEKELNNFGAATATLESRIKRKDGNTVDTLWSVQWSEQDQCLFCVTHDISDRKRNEELVKASELRFRTVLTSTLVGLLTVSDEGRIESANPRISQLLKYTEDDLIGKPISVLFPSMKESEAKSFVIDFSQRNRAKQQKNPNKSVASNLIEMDASSKAGDLVPVELSLGEIETQSGHAYLFSVIDISKRREIQQAKKEFASMIGEDLGVPLNSVQDSLNILSAEELSKVGHNRVTLAQNSVGRLLRLLDDLFEINKLESGQLDLRPSMISIAEVIQRSVDAVRVFAEKHNVILDPQIVDFQLFADGDRLERVLINLLSNAVKFSPQEEKVSVTVEIQDEWVVLRVIDHGRGIPASHINSIFAAFEQVTASDSSKKGGTGLGLAICKAIIEQHGGNIGVESEEGVGSTFWFRLPRSSGNN